MMDVTERRHTSKFYAATGERKGDTRGGSHPRNDNDGHVFGLAGSIYAWHKSHQ